jgi:hypothetical protein
MAATGEVRLTESVYAVTATMVSGASVDLLLFANETDAANYARGLSPLPLGFERVTVNERQVIGVRS